MKIIELEESQIETPFYVRAFLDNSRVELFWELMEEGTKFPPLDVMPSKNGGYVLLDGRTRFEAGKIYRTEKYQCRVLPKMSTLDAMAYAVKANYGVSAPESKDDLIHTINLMMEAKITRSKIIDSFGFIPKKIISTCYDVAYRQMKQKLMTEIIYAVFKQNGQTMEEAIKKINEKTTIKLTDKDIQNEMNIRKRKSKEKKEIVEKMNLNFGLRFRSLQKILNSNLKLLKEMYAEGEVSTIQVKNILEHIGDLMGKVIRNLKDHEKRFNVAAIDINKEKLFI